MSSVKLPRGFWAEYQVAETVDACDRVVEKHFDWRAVDAEDCIEEDTLYYVRNKQRQFVTFEAVGEDADAYMLTLFMTKEQVRPFPRNKLLELGKSGRLVRLESKLDAEIRRQSMRISTAEYDGETPSKSNEYLGDAKKYHPECNIDLSTLTQLLSAARQSGLLPNADQIAKIRDSEFRMGKYRQAMDAIERMAVRFNQEADKRRQKLRAEEIQYKSGALKMTPKQWLQKKQKDTAQTTCIERARKKFAHTLDGLRFLARIS